MSEVILLGEPMGLFTATEVGSLKEAVNFNKSIAGAEINVGIGLSRLEHSVQYVSKLGKDPIGEYIFDALQKESLGTDFIHFDDSYPTGLMLKNKVEEGDPATAYYRKSSAFSTLSVDDVQAIDFSSVRLLHVTGIPPALSESLRESVIYLMKKAKEAGTFITFDPNLRPALWSSQVEMIRVLNELASYANVVLPGVAEGEVLVGSSEVEDIAAFYLNQGADVVITKSGEKGAFVTEKNKETKNVPGFKVEKVIDTVGAGDGFAVGIISAYLEELSWEEAAKRANAIGSLQVQHPGDNEGLPTRDELQKYIERFN
jgi:2-dehydro-3-deoxygluconokinase